MTLRCTRREALAALAATGAAALVPRGAQAFGDTSLLDVGLLRYDSPAWNTRPGAIRRLLLEVEVTTSVAVTDTPSEVSLADGSIFDCPMAIMGGDQGFEPWSTQEREAMSRYLAAGGMLVIDASEGRSDGAFDQAVRRELDAILPSSPLERLDSDHVIFQSFYLIDGAPGRLAIEPFLEGATLDERVAVVYSHNDMMGAWARDAVGNPLFAVHPGGDRQRELAQRLGVNLVMYALCLDYKTDQVHVPFLLERRRWRVDGP